MVLSETETSYVDELMRLSEQEQIANSSFTPTDARGIVRLKYPTLYQAAFGETIAERVRGAVEFEMTQDHTEIEAFSIAKARLGKHHIFYNDFF